MAALLPALLCLLPEPEPEAGAGNLSRVVPRVTLDVRVSRDATVRPPQPQPYHTPLQPLLTQGCNPIHASLQPYTLQPATLCTPQGTFGLLLEDATALLVHLDARGAVCQTGLEP